MDNYSRQSLDRHRRSSRNTWLCNTRAKESGKKEAKHPRSHHASTKCCLGRVRTDCLIECLNGTLVSNSTFSTVNQVAVMSTLNPTGTCGDSHLENLKVYYESHSTFHVDISFHPSRETLGSDWNTVRIALPPTSRHSWMGIHESLMTYFWILSLSFLVFKNQFPSH